MYKTNQPVQMTTDTKMADVIQRTALGRDAHLGDLYNAFTDTFCGISLFKQNIPEQLIQSQDTNRSDIDYVTTDSISEKFEKFKIESDLKMSILCNLIHFNGSGGYLGDFKKSAKCARSSLIYTIQTKSQQINFLNKDLFPYFDLNVLNEPTPTHIIYKINWGAHAIVVCEGISTNDERLKEIQSSLDMSITDLGASIGVDSSSSTDTSTPFRQYMLKIHADVLPSGMLPQSIEEARRFIARIPIMMKECNNGLGKPIVFHLIPVSTVRRLLESSDIQYDVIVKQLSDDQIVRYISYFDGINALKQQINARVDLVKNNQICLNEKYLTEAINLQTDLMVYEANLKSKLAKALIAYRRGEHQYVDVKGFHLIPEFRLRFEELYPVIEKIKRFESIKEKQGGYIGSHMCLDAELVGVPEAFVMYIADRFQKQTPERVSQNFHFFFDLMSKLPAKFMVCDLDLYKHEQVDAICIWHYKNNVVLSKDYFADVCLTDLNIIQNTGECELVFHKPNKRITLELMCPEASNGICCCSMLVWHCHCCHKEIEYAFDGYFYCDCGRGNISSYVFRCSNISHSNFTAYSEKRMKESLEMLRPMKELNVLVLGPTGVGKSTWLNSIVNYLTYDSLEEARTAGVRCVIPASFSLSDDNFDVQNITLGGEDENEILAAGQSATQQPKTYSFSVNDTLVRIIDTPGIGDVRGIDQDKENVNMILQHISHLSEIHGICILLKPDEARLDVLFRFCIKELLVHLHKSAGTNIVFCFTNARKTFYRPGNTFTTLQGLLKELDIDEITLSKHTVYCLDNEAFKFLCTLKYPNITYDDDERDSFYKSWAKSVSETKRLLQHIMQLPPHKIRDTTNLCDARRIILNLTKPMADINQNIELNIVAIQEQERRIKNSEESEKTLAERLYIPQVVLVPKKLNQPRTVCTSPSCVDYYELKSTNTRQVLYKTHCHVACCLKSVTPDVFPNAELKRCWAMNQGATCRVCKCRWEKHMHITYEQEREEQSVINTNVRTAIDEEKSARAKIEEHVEHLRSLVEKYRKEQEIIRKISVKFGNFLKANAIAPYNDAMKSYLQYLIAQEETKYRKTTADEAVLLGLKDTLHRYDEEVSIIQGTMTRGDEDQVTASDVKNLVKDLYSLPLMGEQLKNIVEVAVESNTKAVSYNERCVTIEKEGGRKSGYKKWFKGLSKLFFPEPKDGIKENPVF